MRMMISFLAGCALFATGVAAADLGVVSPADYFRFEILALDSAGCPAAPDSGHLLVWFEGESTTDAASYTSRWTNAGAGSAIVDSVRFAGHTYYYFIDQVGDIDNDEGQGLYTGAVVLYADYGLPTSNSFTFTLAGDECADYLALLTNLDEPVSGIDDNPWDNAERQLTAFDEDYTTIDIDGVLGGGGSGAYSVALVTYDSTNDRTVPGVCLGVRNLAQTALLATAVTDASGRAYVNLDAGSYLLVATAPGYTFAAFDTVVVPGAETDTAHGVWFDPGTPASPTLCRVFGYLFTTDGRAEAGARVTASLPNGIARMGEAIISPAPVTTTVGESGYFSLDLAPSPLLSGSPSYEFTINRADGTILRKRVSVPESGNWQLSW
jgi:hypothetical protein